MSNRRKPTVVAVPAAVDTEVDALAVIEQYSRELAQERHDRIVAQCAQRQLETRCVELVAQLARATEQPDPLAEEGP